MTKTFKTNSDGDIYAIGGYLQIATGLTAVLQTCERAMKTYLGEMIYAADRGVDYFNYVFGSSANIIQFESGARAQILRVDGVTGILSFSAIVENNELVYSVEIETEYGTDTITGSTGA